MGNRQAVGAVPLSRAPEAVRMLRLRHIAVGCPRGQLAPLQRFPAQPGRQRQPTAPAALPRASRAPSESHGPRAKAPRAAPPVGTMAKPQKRAVTR